MRRALIGYTGFVGSNLYASGDYTDLYNSRNVEAMRGEAFDEVVCAGVPAVKWLANREPERDREQIAALLDVLRTVDVGRFVLVSTIDVYPDPRRPLDEDYEPDGSSNHSYGRHRLEIERFVSDRFADRTIARLPALFGRGLKKNVLFDLLTGNNTDRIDPSAVFQWYPLRRLGRDLETARANGLTLVNLFPEPIATRRVIARFFPYASVGEAAASAPVYDLRTRHAELFGGSAGYLTSADAVLTEMKGFVDERRTATSPGA